MPPLLSPKVVRVAQLLDQKHRQAAGSASSGSSSDNDWAAMVFVETKVG